MILKSIILVCAVFGAFALMAAFWSGAFQPISQGFLVPGTTYSPVWAHLVLVGVVVGVMSLKAK